MTCSVLDSNMTSSVDYKVGRVISDIATPTTHPEELEEYTEHGGIDRLVQPAGLLTREGTEYSRDNKMLTLL